MLAIPLAGMIWQKLMQKADGQNLMSLLAVIWKYRRTI